MGVSKFSMGKLVVTSGVHDLIVESVDFNDFVANSIRRHCVGDWGDLCSADKKENELALKVGDLRLFSAYKSAQLPKIWIITEADRSVTTVLFPDEY